MRWTTKWSTNSVLNRAYFCSSQIYVSNVTDMIQTLIFTEIWSTKLCSYCLKYFFECLEKTSYCYAPRYKQVVKFFQDFSQSCGPFSKHHYNLQCIVEYPRRCIQNGKLRLRLMNLISFIQRFKSSHYTVCIQTVMNVKNALVKTYFSFIISKITQSQFLNSTVVREAFLCADTMPFLSQWYHCRC